MSESTTSAQNDARAGTASDRLVPDLGAVVGLRRLYRAAVERMRRADIPEADK